MSKLPQVFGRKVELPGPRISVQRFEKVPAVLVSISSTTSPAAAVKLNVSRSATTSIEQPARTSPYATGWPLTLHAWVSFSALAGATIALNRIAPAAASARFHGHHRYRMSRSLADA